VYVVICVVKVMHFVFAAISNLKLHDDCTSLDRDTVGPLPAPNTMPTPWGGTHMPYSGTYLPHTGAGYAPMPFNYTNEPSVYGYAHEESVHSGSGKFGIIK
jgi:segment polarity protein dishevelled